MSAGAGWPSTAQRSRKCCTYEALSESAVLAHFSAKACGVNVAMATMLPAVRLPGYAPRERHPPDGARIVHNLLCDSRVDDGVPAGKERYEDKRRDRGELAAALYGHA